MDLRTSLQFFPKSTFHLHAILPCKHSFLFTPGPGSQEQQKCADMLWQS